MNPSDDIRWMRRALELARRGEALAVPNPMVGAVVVSAAGENIGEGFHLYDGMHHAEIIALDAARQRNASAIRGATLYVTLEPCCHTGRTGPCTEAIIAAGIARVVAAMRDPNPLVAGKGLGILRRAGIEVTDGVCEAEARELNAPFARWITSRQPLVTLKVAMSLDARIALPQQKKRRRGSVTYITSPEARAEVQNLRHSADAILTGIGTVLADNPLLTDRSGRPRRKKLLRVVLDSRLRLPLRSQLVRTCDSDVLVFTRAPLDSSRATALRRKGVDVVRIHGGAKQEGLNLSAVLDELGRLEVQHLLIEGGAQVNAAALAAGVVDRVVAYIAPRLLGSDAVPVAAAPHAALGGVPPLTNLRMRIIGPDLCITGDLRNVYRNHSNSR